MTLVLLAAIALVAFSTEGAIGFGATVIIASVGAQLVPLDVLLPAFVPLNVLLSSYLVARTHEAIAWRVLLVIIAPLVGVGALVGLVLVHVVDPSRFALALGLFVVVLSLLQLLRPAVRPLSPLVARTLLVLGGIAHGMFGTGGPMIVYVARRELGDKRTFRATLAVLWLALALALVVNYAALGLYSSATAPFSLVIAIALIPGLVLGDRLHRALDARIFERVVWIVLLVAGTALALRSM